jgi:YD repeat-containing protein
MQILSEYQGSMNVTRSDAIPESDDWRQFIERSGDEFDPAAWHLKQIVLPSGGEIHIQYEEKDYKYVQDRPAMTMVSVQPDYLNDAGNFAINLKDLGIDQNNSEQLNLLKDAILDYYFKNEEDAKKIYYKFLYALKGNNPRLNNPKSEYITGYAAFGGVTVDPVKKEVRIELNESDKSLSNGGYSKIPKTAGIEYYKYNRNGVLDNKNSQPLLDEIFEPTLRTFANTKQGDLPQPYSPSLGADELNMIKQFGSSIARTIAKGSFLTAVPNEDELKEEVCNELNPCISFIKIPVIFAKRGGGVRVKRILLYDKGIEDGSAVVYGNQYRYVLDDGVSSSGVASNEPGSIREENPLISYLPKKGQNWWNRITTGIDKEQTEGPFGESLLPAPFIIYSRVVVENIHTGKTGTGFSVNEYYTTKDYPFDAFYKEMENSDFSGNAYDKTEVMNEIDKLYLPAGILSFRVNKLWMAQGFRFILNSMNGVQKRITGYGGQYHIPDDVNNYKRDTDGGYIVSQQEYEYFEPGEKIAVWSWGNGQILQENIVPGKEMDLAAEKKQSKDFSVDFRLAIDPSVGVCFLPPIFVLANLGLSFDTKLISTHSSTKVIRYPAILKKVRSFTDGMYSETENMIFDKGTGNPLVTRSTDSYYGLPDESGQKSDASYYSFNVPAYWFYPGMGKKSVDPDNNNILSAMVIKVNTFGKKDEAMPKSGADGSITRNNPPLILNFKNVVNLSVQTYKNNWSGSWENPKIASRYGVNSGQTILNSIWRPWSSFIYQSNLTNSGKGLFDLNAVPLLIDQNYVNDEKWIKASEITKYTPHGNPVEELNALGIYSSVLYDKAFNFVVPSMVAGNAQYEAIYFNSFEGAQGTTDARFKAHSGDKCYQYYGFTNLIDGVYLTQNLQRSGARVFVWVHEDNMDGISATLSGNSLVITEKAKVDGWILYHIDLSPQVLSEVPLNTPLNISLNRVGGSFYIDDVRFQPLDAQASCFVYDNSMRLVTQFDDQHFGTYFQYNDEGQLVRKIVETERGKKTIQETQYNLPKK